MNRNERVLAVWVYVVLCFGGGLRAAERPADLLYPTLDAICMVESSGGRDVRVGDDGLAVGPYQIHPGYVRDVNMWLRRMGVPCQYTLADRADMQKARHMTAVYVTCWAHAKGLSQTPETWARIHNGGPNGCSKPATISYWRRVQRRLNDV